MAAPVAENLEAIEAVGAAPGRDGAGSSLATQEPATVLEEAAVAAVHARRSSVARPVSLTGRGTLHKNKIHDGILRPDCPGTLRWSVSFSRFVRC